MTYFEALEKNSVAGIGDSCVKTVDSVISKVFLYEKFARKVYRYDNGFVGRLDDPTFRKKFVQEDFVWNNLMCPEIYFHLEGAKQIDGVWYVCSMAEAEDYSIVMAKVDVEKNLHHTLLQGKADEAIVCKVADTMMTRLHNLTVLKAAEIPTFKRPWRELFLLRLQDLREWCGMVPEQLPLAYVQKILLALEKIADDPYVRAYDPAKMQVAIDNHAGNILIFDHGIEFLDIYQFKEHWLAVDPLVNITRPAADVFALGGKELGKAFLKAATPYYPMPNDKIVYAYLIEAALILVAYQYMLKKPDIAVRYMQWIDMHFSKIQ